MKQKYSNFAVEIDAWKQWKHRAPSRLISLALIYMLENTLKASRKRELYCFYSTDFWASR